MQAKKHNQYHHRLNLPVEFVPQPLDMSDGYHKIYPVDRVNKNLLEFFNSLGCDIGHGEQFLLQPNGMADYHIIHIDNDDDLPLVKINYVYCDTPHVMNWYELREGAKLKKAQSSANTNYFTCDPHDVEKVFSATVGQPSLVNVKKLHDVSTVSSPRTCYSLVVVENETLRRLTWEEAEFIFSDYILDY